jgi:N-acetylglutamate synthase-like GNAT family acetyltransferase
LIIPLEWEYVHAWASLYESFYASCSWTPVMDEKRVRDLLTRTGNTESWVAIEDGDVTAIGTLETDDDHKTGSIQNLAFRQTHEPAALMLLRHLESRARVIGLETVVLGTWESMTSILDLVSKAGYQIRNRMSLMHADLDDDIVAPEADSCFTIQSLADRISIDDFVAANRLAFEKDKSRLLERDELEYWIESLPGHRSELQLASLINDKIVGTVMSEYEEVMRADSRLCRAWVYGLGVTPDMRRSDVATCLMMELFQRLRSYGVHDVWLLTDLDGPGRMFYETVSFHRATIWLEFTAGSRLF